MYYLWFDVSKKLYLTKKIKVIKRHKGIVFQNIVWE